MTPTTEIHKRLLELLTGYLSRIMAQSIIDRALAQCKVTADHLSPGNVVPVVEQARIGIGIFCDPDRLSSLMIDLAAFCDTYSRKPGSLAMSSADPPPDSQRERESNRRGSEARGPISDRLPIDVPAHHTGSDHPEPFVKRARRCSSQFAVRVYRPLALSAWNQACCVE